MTPKLKNLWYFWDGPKIPAVCSLGIKTLLARSGGFDTCLLNSKNIRDYLPELHSNWDTINKWNWKVDFIKPRILDKYGGIFVDVDVICLEDLKILTNELEQSNATFMVDGLGKEIFLSFSLMVAKPNNKICKNMIKLQDLYVEKNKWKIKNWHDVGSNILNKCRIPNELIIIRYQRPFPVADSRKKYLSKEHWSKFIRKTKGIPKPVIWPISCSSYFNCPELKDISEFNWLNGSSMISTAFRYGLRKSFKALI
jgi:hypothetical protein